MSNSSPRISLGVGSCDENNSLIQMLSQHKIVTRVTHWTTLFLILCSIFGILCSKFGILCFRFGLYYFVIVFIYGEHLHLGLTSFFRSSCSLELGSFLELSSVFGVVLNFEGVFIFVVIFIFEVDFIFGNISISEVFF